MGRAGTFRFRCGVLLWLLPPPLPSFRGAEGPRGFRGHRGGLEWPPARGARPRPTRPPAERRRRLGHVRAGPPPLALRLERAGAGGGDARDPRPRPAPPAAAAAAAPRSPGDWARPGPADRGGEVSAAAGRGPGRAQPAPESKVLPGARPGPARRDRVRGWGRGCCSDPSGPSLPCVGSPGWAVAGPYWVPGSTGPAGEREVL